MEHMEEKFPILEYSFSRVQIRRTQSARLDREFSRKNKAKWNNMRKPLEFFLLTVYNRQVPSLRLDISPTFLRDLAKFIGFLLEFARNNQEESLLLDISSLLLRDLAKITVFLLEFTRNNRKNSFFWIFLLSLFGFSQFHWIFCDDTDKETRIMD